MPNTRPYETPSVSFASGVQPVGVDRRSQPRLPIEVDVEVEGGARRFSATSVDLSAGGMLLATSEIVPVGVEVILGFALPNGSELRVLGTVRWRRPLEEGGGLGVAFFCLEPEARATLERFCRVRVKLYSDPFHRDD